MSLTPSHLSLTQEPQRGSTVRRVARWLAPAVLFLLAVSTHLPLAFAQAAAPTEASEETKPEPAEEAPPPISLADIPAERAAFEKKSREISSRLEQSQSLDSTQAGGRATEGRAGSYPRENQPCGSGRVRRSAELMDLDSEAIRHATLLEEATARLDSATRGFEGDLGELDALTRRWLALRQAAAERNAPHHSHRTDQQHPRRARRADNGTRGTGATTPSKCWSEAMELSSQVADYRAEAAAQRREMMVQSVTSEDEPIWRLGWVRQGDSFFRHLVSAAQDRRRAPGFLHPRQRQSSHPDLRWFARGRADPALATQGSGSASSC